MESRGAAAVQVRGDAAAKLDGIHMLEEASLLAGLFIRSTPMNNPAACRVDEDIRQQSVLAFMQWNEKKERNENCTVKEVLGVFFPGKIRGDI